MCCVVVAVWPIGLSVAVVDVVAAGCLCSASVSCVELGFLHRELYVYMGCVLGLHMVGVVLRVLRLYGSCHVRPSKSGHVCYGIAHLHARIVWKERHNLIHNSVAITGKRF